MTRNIKLTIQYDGTNFHGWQIQPKKRTVQGEIEAALKILFKTHTRLSGSGRTDTGVHALGQVANFKTSSSLSLDYLRKAINANTDDDVSVIKAEEVKSDFHAQYSAKKKTYRYSILNADVRNPLKRHFYLFFPYKLNVSAIKRVSKDFVGRKNFKSFQGNNRCNQDQNPIRTIHSITIKKEGNNIYIDITADGFLYKMVRTIVGTLLEVGNGRLAEKEIKKIFQSKSRCKASATAKAHGLLLKKVIY